MENSQKKIIISLIPVTIAAILLLLAWTEPSKDLVKDPWYRTLDKMNEALKIRKEDPNSPKFQELMNQAGTEFSDLVEKHPYHAKLRMLNGYYLMNVGQPDSAISELKVAIDKGKGGLVNQIEFQAGDMLTQVAINKSEAMFKFARDNKQPAIALQANTFLKELVPYAPHNPNMHFQYGKSFAELGNYYKALENYEQAIRIQPNHEPAGRGKAHLNFVLGNKFVNDGNMQQAYVHYKIAQSIIPNHPDYNNNLGNACLQLGKFKEAVKHFGLANKKDPNNKVFKGNLEIAKKALANNKK
jgi:tetratricopeptide (TPR) repeat protein